MKYFKADNRGLSKFFIVMVLGLVVAIIAAVVVIIITSQSGANPDRITLTMWGVWDESSDVSDVIAEYENAHPYITIKYQKMRLEEYENRLEQGWADEPSSGPDIYALPNTWLNKYAESRITPMPKNTTVAFFRTQKILFKSDVQIKYITEPALTAEDIKRDYIDVAYDDIIIDNQVMAMPFGINTLILYYNRELLNQANLAQPPQTWGDFANTISKIAIIDENTNNIIRAGTALGTYNNIDRSSDIVSLLLMQNGTDIVRGQTVTMSSATQSDPTYFPAEEALRFYTDFSSPEKAVYTWNPMMPTALDFFAEGNLNFYFGYKYQEPEIIAKGRGLDYGIAPMPQVNMQNRINYANYWIYTVSHKTKNADEAWNFLQYASNAKRVSGYLESTGQTSVLRSLLNEQLADPDNGFLAQQALTAESWYRGRSPQAAEDAFDEMIQNIVNKSTEIKQAISTATQKIQLGY